MPGAATPRIVLAPTGDGTGATGWAAGGGARRSGAANPSIVRAIGGLGAGTCCTGCCAGGGGCSFGAFGASGDVNPIMVCAAVGAGAA